MKIYLLAGLIFASQLAFSAAYKLDPSHSEVGFKVKHLMISDVKGRFEKFEGSFEFDEKKNELTSVVVKIDASTVNTNDKKRDEHLQSPDFLDAKKFPEITFVTSKPAKISKGKNKISGDLTIHGVTKPITLMTEYRGSATDPWGNERVGFSSTVKISRKDYGLNWNKSLDKGGVLVGDEVTINIEGEAVKQSADQKK